LHSSDEGILIARSERSRRAFPGAGDRIEPGGGSSPRRRGSGSGGGMEAQLADVKRGDRPLSPHLTIYRPQITSVLSILHRVAGCGLALGGVLGVWWFLAAASGPDYFAFVDGLITSWVGGLVMIGLLAALWYHFCNGIRHLVWDAGYGFDLATVQRSGLATLAGAAALTVITLIAAFL
jgi:succinate dehydrogenase / fumarate reductase cytochrome b subunit